VNTLRPIAVVVLLLSIIGCVTEGGLAIEPQSDEEQADANLAVGIGYLQQGRPDIAIDSLERALELEPRSADAHSMIAIAYDQVDDIESAEEHHRRATQLAPRSPIPQNAYAVFLCRQNRWSDARPHFDAAIANVAPAVPINYMLNAATCARAGGDLSGAESYYRAALQIDAAQPDALRGLVDVLIRSENFFSARAMWQRLEASAPIGADDLLSCYLIETGMGDRQAATDCANRLTNEFPGSTAQRQLRELERNAG
jgi:type IV pilus assembly protein PilF